MIAYDKYQLDNGLRLIVHEDHSTPMVAVNVVYDVGSRDEDPLMTGFAHLFEHLMFGGSENIPDFDKPIQMAGGENNAFTNNDLTNFYEVLPAENIETALWLESDRMLKLKFSEEALDTQKKVVIEEFKETCLNEPYGDMWHHLSEMCYTNHSYRWPTIGKIPEHIAEAKLQDVVGFFYKHYTPSNAVITIAGKIDSKEAYRLTKKWFGDIPSGKKYERKLDYDDRHIGYQYKEVVADVPAPSLILGFPMYDRTNPDYYTCDVLSDILSNGRSSRFYENLHKNKRIFNQIDAYISGTFDPGLFIIEGRPVEGVSMDEAKKHIWNELQKISTEKVEERELQKIKNKIELSLEYAEVNILHKAMSISYFEVLGDAEGINQEAEKYQRVNSDRLMTIAQTIFDPENCVELRYIPK